MGQDLKLSRYVGIPWLLGGRTLQGCDCLGLALLVQREIFGRVIPDVWHYDGENYGAMSLVFPDEMIRIGFIEVQDPLHGDVAFTKIARMGHVSTLLFGAHLTITQFSSSSWKVRKLPFRYFRPGR